MRTQHRGVSLVPNWVRLVPNGTNLALFNRSVSFSTFWLTEPSQNALILIIKSSKFVIFVANLTSMPCVIFVFVNLTIR